MAAGWVEGTEGRGRRGTGRERMGLCRRAGGITETVWVTGERPVTRVRADCPRMVKATSRVARGSWGQCLVRTQICSSGHQTCREYSLPCGKVGMTRVEWSDETGAKGSTGVRLPEAPAGLPEDLWLRNHQVGAFCSEPLSVVALTGTPRTRGTTRA
jgi:hypothetical protein